MILDVPREWADLFLRIRSAIPLGQAIINVTILVNNEGLPCLWMKPDVRLIEPRRTEMAEIIKALCGEGEGPLTEGDR